MKPDIYQLAAEAEKTHWWFCARREILETLFREVLPTKLHRRILEVGCGNGGNLNFLTQFGDLYAFELDEHARDNAKALAIGTVEKGWLPHGNPYKNLHFDLIVALDVLEHIEDDELSLTQIKEICSPNGLLILTVPAYQWLWSAYDEVCQHKRRYTLESLSVKIQGAGFDIVKCGYFNTFLFPVSLLVFFLERVTGVNLKYTTLRTPAKVPNLILKTVFSLEKQFISNMNFPFGLSVFICAKPCAPSAIH